MDIPKEQLKENFEYAKEELRILLAKRKGPPDTAAVKRAFIIKSREAQLLGEFFRDLKGSPCSTCPPEENCCRMGHRSGKFPAGYFYYEEIHPDVLSGEVDLMSLVVPLEEHEEMSRCIFLSPIGCNIPYKYRSRTCLKYACRKLGDVLGTGPQWSRQFVGKTGEHSKHFDVSVCQLHRTLKEQREQRRNPCS